MWPREGKHKLSDVDAFKTSGSRRSSEVKKSHPDLHARTADPFFSPLPCKFACKISRRRRLKIRRKCEIEKVNEDVTEREGGETSHSIRERDRGGEKRYTFLHKKVGAKK